MKPSIPKGTRDYSSSELKNREYLKTILNDTFKHFGYLPIETPSFEKSSTLLEKYGDEGDQLVFKILNSGEKVRKANVEALQNNDLRQFTHSLSEKALRYDLTVPFARYVAQHQNELVFPFKRYQMQLVWRADRPQHGRFQEFLQCDADVVGSKSLWQEVELIQLYATVFSKIGMNGVTLRINNRKILYGLSESIGESERFGLLTLCLDKLDKIGLKGVIEELIRNGFSDSSIKKLVQVIEAGEDYNSLITLFTELLKDSELGMNGLEELKFIISQSSNLIEKTKFSIVFDPTLARGLSYYTGSIFEVSPPKNVKMGSIGGGGRYDDLTSTFGLKDISGVGISFGFDRILLVMEELGLLNSIPKKSIHIVCANFGDEYVAACQKLIAPLRKMNGLTIEVYPDSAKLKKQVQYASKKEVDYLLMIGEEELKNKTFVFKNMKTRMQQSFPFTELEAQFTSLANRS